MVRSLADCEKVMSRETKNLVEKNQFITYEISVKLEQTKMYMELNKRSVVEVLRHQALLLGGDGLVM